MTQLFCLAHAGGSARALARTLARHPTGAAPVGLELPGRGGRAGEPAHSAWEPAVDDLTARLLDAWDGGPVALLGHSLGALLAYELAHRLRERGGPRPVLLVVVARNPPHRPPEHSPMADAVSDEDLFAAVVALGGAPPRAAGPLTYRSFLPTLRADLALARGYAPRPGRTPLDVPLLVVQGSDDALTCADAMAEWAAAGAGPLHLRTLPGDHFFVHHDPAAVARLVRTALHTPPEERSDAHHLDRGAARAARALPPVRP